MTFTLKDISIYLQHKHTFAFHFVKLSGIGIFQQNSNVSVAKKCIMLSTDSHICSGLDKGMQTIKATFYIMLSKKTIAFFNMYQFYSLKYKIYTL